MSDVDITRTNVRIYDGGTMFSTIESQPMGVVTSVEWQWEEGGSPESTATITLAGIQIVEGRGVEVELITACDGRRFRLVPVEDGEA